MNARKERISAFLRPPREIVRLKRLRADCYGYEAHPYDALLESYEPGMTSAKLKAIFEPFKLELGGLLPQIAQPQIDDRWIPAANFGRGAAGLEPKGLEGNALRFESGGQDLSAHPFTINLIPTMAASRRWCIDDIREMLYSIHEAGLCFVGARLAETTFRASPAAEACSLGIHESQSRLWENNIACSLAFWDHFSQFPRMFPTNCQGKA
ncbi:MAG: hypothetical protein IPP17_03415 [Bacteroidetes bacterium]|nr:hypothetical protein [Bacteroidota bacterium]